MLQIRTLIPTNLLQHEMLLDTSIHHHKVLHHEHPLPPLLALFQALEEGGDGDLRPCFGVVVAEGFQEDGDVGLLWGGVVAVVGGADEGLR
jgi:hypothetical protein